MSSICCKKKRHCAMSTQDGIWRFLKPDRILKSPSSSTECSSPTLQFSINSTWHYVPRYSEINMIERNIRRVNILIVTVHVYMSSRFWSQAFRLFTWKWAYFTHHNRSIWKLMKWVKKLINLLFLESSLYFLKLWFQELSQDLEKKINFHC